jgi:hypothetical protein
VPPPTLELGAALPALAAPGLGLEPAATAAALLLGVTPRRRITLPSIQPPAAPTVVADASAAASATARPISDDEEDEDELALFAPRGVDALPSPSRAYTRSFTLPKAPFLGQGEIDDDDDV